MPPRRVIARPRRAHSWLTGLLLVLLLALVASACSDMGLNAPTPDPPSHGEPGPEPPADDPADDDPADDDPAIDEPPADDPADDDPADDDPAIDEPPPATGGIRGEVLVPVDAARSKTAVPFTLVRHATPGAAAIVAGAVMVQVREQAPAADGLRVALEALVRTPAVVRASGVARTYELRFDHVDEASTRALAQELRAHPEVLAAETVPVVWPLAFPNDEYYALQWALTAARVPDAWALLGAADGTVAPAVVAIVDTGSQAHPDLQNLPGWDFVDGDDDPRDPGASDGGIGSHGVHVAGTAVARTHNTIGVAGVHPNGRVLPLRVIGSDGNGSLADVAYAITWAAGGTLPGLPANANPAAVINLSLGGPVTSCPSFLQAAIDDAHARGSVVVAAAGNGKEDAGGTSPANCAQVVTVGAVGPGGVRAPYSNFGAHVDLMAPGGDFSLSASAVDAGVLSTSWDYRRDQPDYVLMEGTSMAAPHVSGALALLRGKHPELGPAEAVERLLATARPMSARECDRPSASDCGVGTLDAYTALLAADDPGGEPDDPGEPDPGEPPGEPDPGEPDPGEPDPGEPDDPAESVMTYVIADLCVTATCSIIDQSGSRFTALEAGREAGPYAFDDLPNGTYEIWAFRDLDGDGAWDGDEPWAVYPLPVQVEGAVVAGIDVEVPAAPLSGYAAEQQSLRSRPQGTR